MYKIVGADGQQYGPVSAEQVRAWIREGRASRQTKAQAEGATEWKTLGDFPEFSDLLAPAAPPAAALPPLGSASVPMQAQVEEMVRGPAYGLMVVAILGAIVSLTGLIMNLAGVGMNFPGIDPNAEALTRMFAGTLGVVSIVVSLLLSALIFWGASKMKRLENYPLAMTASILALVPCLSPCCLLGLPLGIWSVVVLAKPEVRNVFH